MKGQRSKGLIGPIILRQAPHKHRSNSRDDGDSSDDDNAQSFADAIQQLAWTKDIDLTKGKALVSDADVIEKTSPRSDMDNNNKSNGTAIPNGKPKAFHKFVKKPPGTPKTSPKPSLRTLTVNKISPLYEVKSQSEESCSDADVKKTAWKDSSIDDNVKKTKDDKLEEPDIKKTDKDDHIIMVKSDDSDKEVTVDKIPSGGYHSDPFDVDEKPKSLWFVPKSEKGDASQDSDSKGENSSVSPKRSPSKKVKKHKRHGSPSKKKEQSRSSSTASLLHLAEYSSKESEG
jgi:hypothetical protein